MTRPCRSNRRLHSHPTSGCIRLLGPCCGERSNSEGVEFCQAVIRQTEVQPYSKRLRDVAAANWSNDMAHGRVDALTSGKDSVDEPLGG